MRRRSGSSGASDGTQRLPRLLSGSARGVDKRLLGSSSTARVSGKRRQTLADYARTHPLAAANRYASVDAATLPALRELGYVPSAAPAALSAET